MIQRIDVHQHFIPEFYKSALAKVGVEDAGGNPWPKWSMDKTVELLDRHDMGAMLSISSPGTYFGDPGFAGFLCRKLNEHAAQLVSDHPGRLGVMAVVPLPDVAGALKGDAYVLEWVPIANPDQNRGNATGPSGTTITSAAGPFVQGWLQGALRMNRGEGIWYAQGKMYVMDTSGGAVSRGAIWELDLATQVFRCIYSSPNTTVGNMGDNLTVSPRNAILICEDASTAATDTFGYGQRLMGITQGGDAYIFAKNNVQLTTSQLNAAGKLDTLAGDHRDNEFAGACFDPTGRYLFVNIQTPGITFAISGPWAKGPL